jgi:hypothetical protein
MKTLRHIAVRMKAAFSITRKLSVLLAILCLGVRIQKAEAEIYLSNLANLWTQGGIGDIHDLTAGSQPYGDYVASFTTGAGSYSLNAVTFEFYFNGTRRSLGPSWIGIGLYQGSAYLGSYGNPAVDPTPTQWPQSSNPNSYTQFIDFTPLQQQTITLNPFTQYTIDLSMPGNTTAVASLLFSRSSAYASVDGWVMGATTSGNPAAFGERIMMALDATPVPEPNTATLLLGGIIVLMRGWRSLGKRASAK